MLLPSYLFYSEGFGLLLSYPEYSFPSTLMWSGYFPDGLSARGPYKKSKMSDQYCMLLEKDMVLFPEGPPFCDRNWATQTNSTVEDYNSFVLKLIGGVSRHILCSCSGIVTAS